MIPSSNSRAHISFSAAQRRVLAVFLCLAMVGASAMITFGSSLFPAAEATAQAETVFGSAVPTTASDPDSRAVDVATRMMVTVSGKITAIRFYKSAQNTGVHTGTIWGTGGKAHAKVTFKNETASGWQVATLSTPMKLNAGTTIIVSYHAPVGHYADDAGYFTGKGAGAGHVVAVPDSASRPNALYHYGTTSAFPTSTWRASNYWVDAVFVPDSATAPPTTAPQVTTKPTVAPTTTPPTVKTTVPPATTPPTVKTTVPPVTGTCALTKAAESCWASHTGVPGYSEAQILAGQSPLTHVTGNVTITVPGTVLSNQWIDGCIAVKASNVTIQNVLVRTADKCKGGNMRSGGFAIDTGNGDGGAGSITNLMVKDTEIDGLKPNIDSGGIGTNNYTCLRCNIHGRAKQAYVDVNDVIQDSYIHDNDAPPGDHLDGIFYDGGAGNIMVKHNFITMAGQAVTAALGMINDYPGGYITVDSNYLEGGAGADLVCGAGSAKHVAFFHHVVVTNNALSPRNGFGGTDFTYAFDPSQPGNSWTNNYNSDTMAAIGNPGVD